MADKTSHVAMFPWFAMGHLIPFLEISNRLAERGFKISFFIPANTKPKLEHLNCHPHLIGFIPIVVPHEDGLPLGAETTADLPCISGLPYNLVPLLMTAMNLTLPAIKAFLKDLNPQFMFYDFAHWISALARGLGIKSIRYTIVSPAIPAYNFSLARKLHEKKYLDDQSVFMEPPAGFPLSSSIKLSLHKALEVVRMVKGCPEQVYSSYSECDAICLACREMEWPYCDYMEEQFKRPVVLAELILPRPPTSTLEERCEKWLGGFGVKTVIYCALGSECLLQKSQLEEPVLHLEQTGMPFLAVLKPLKGAKSLKAMLPEGFEDRTKGRGIIYGGWVQWQLILRHSFIGCFATHCGSGSLPSAKLMSRDLKVGVEVEKDEEGFFTREGLCKAIRLAMDDDNEVGKEAKANFTKWRELLLSDGFESSYMDSFIEKLQGLLE